MSRVDELVAELLTNTGALGVWLLGSTVVQDNQPRNQVLAAAVKGDSAVKPPAKIVVEAETYFDFIDWQLYAERIGGATLVFIFDDRSSLGLIRLRVRHAKDAIKRALDTRVH